MNSTRWRGVMWMGFVAIGCHACRGGASPSAPPGVVLGRLSVTSKAFEAGGAIPVDYTCDGADHSPPLAWSAPPAGTRALVVVVEDLDAAFTHWLATNVAPATLTLAEAVEPAALGGEEGMNSFGRVGYAGPCPPRREMHHYSFHVFALSAPLAIGAGATREAVDEAMSQHVLAEGRLVGTFAH